MPSMSTFMSGSLARPVMCPGLRLWTSWHVRQYWEPCGLYDKKIPGFYKTQWCSDGMVSLCSNTYYCQDAEGHNKLSSKGLQINAISDALTYKAYCHALTTGLSSIGLNPGIGDGPSGHLYTYQLERTALVSTQSPCTCERCSQPPHPSAGLPADEMATSIITDNDAAAGGGEYQMRNLQLQWPFGMLLADCSGSSKSTLTMWLVVLSSHVMMRMPTRVLLFYSHRQPVSCLRIVMRISGKKNSSFWASTVLYNQIIGATAALSSPTLSLYKAGDKTW